MLFFTTLTLLGTTTSGLWTTTECTLCGATAWTATWAATGGPATTTRAGTTTGICRGGWGDLAGHHRRRWAWTRRAWLLCSWLPCWFDSWFRSTLAWGGFRRATTRGRTRTSPALLPHTLLGCKGIVAWAGGATAGTRARCRGVFLGLERIVPRTRSRWFWPWLRRRLTCLRFRSWLRCRFGSRCWRRWFGSGFWCRLRRGGRFSRRSFLGRFRLLSWGRLGLLWGQLSFWFGFWCCRFFSLRLRSRLWSRFCSWFWFFCRSSISIFSFQTLYYRWFNC